MRRPNWNSSLRPVWRASLNEVTLRPGFCLHNPSGVFLQLLLLWKTPSFMISHTAFKCYLWKRSNDPLSSDESTSPSLAMGRKRASATCLYQKIKLGGGGCFPGGSVVKNLPAKPEDISNAGSNLWVGKILGGRKWQPTPVFLPGKSHGQRILAGHSPWGCKKSNSAWEIEHARTHTYCWFTLLYSRAFYGVAQKVGHDRSDLAAAAAAETNTTVKQLYSNKD